MNKEDLILLAVVGGGVFLMARYLAGRTRNSSVPAGPANTYGATEVMRDSGWIYYSDGTAVGPDGRYYFQGQQVYDPRGMYK